MSSGNVQVAQCLLCVAIRTGDAYYFPLKQLFFVFQSGTYEPIRRNRFLHTKVGEVTSNKVRDNPKLFVVTVIERSHINSLL